MSKIRFQIYKLIVRIRKSWLIGTSWIYCWLMYLGGWLFQMGISDVFKRELERVDRKEKAIERQIGKWKEKGIKRINKKKNKENKK